MGARARSGLAPGGWVAVDRASLVTPFPGVYAVGDVDDIPMAKARVFAENAAGVVADDIVARLHCGRQGRPRGHAARALVRNLIRP